MKRAVDFLGRLSIEHLWVLAIGAGIIAFLNTHPVLPHDFWWHMAVGRQILASGQIPQVDTFSYTAAGLPYLSYNQFWLMEVVLYGVYQAGGIILVILFQTAVVASAYLLIVRLAYRLSLNWRAAAFGLFFAAALGFDSWNVRPQAAAYLYAALLMTVIAELQDGGSRRWLAAVPVLMALWVNSHGSFPIGLALVGIWGLQDLKTVLAKRQNWQNLRLPMAAGVLALLGCLLNPSGLGFVRYLRSMAASPIIQQFTTEWQPPGFDTLPGSIFLVCLLLFALLMAFSPRRPSLSLALTFLIFSLLGLRYLRGVVWFGLVLAPFAAEHLAALMEQHNLGVSTAQGAPAIRRVNLLFAATLGLLVILSLPWFKNSLPLAPEKKVLIGLETPVEAVSCLQEKNLPGRVFHYQPYGSYLIWAAQPQYPVFVDSRLELYPAQVWADYFAINAALSGWQERLAAYQADILLLDRAGQPELVRAALADGWQTACADPQTLVLFKP